MCLYCRVKPGLQYGTDDNAVDGLFEVAKRQRYIVNQSLSSNMLKLESLLLLILPVIKRRDVYCKRPYTVGADVKGTQTAIPLTVHTIKLCRLSNSTVNVVSAHFKTSV